MHTPDDTIAAIATPAGTGALHIVRVSGHNAIKRVNAVFSGKDLSRAKGYTLHYGDIVDGDRKIDEVLVTVFRAPKSYTTEDMVEISCHGSTYISGEILKLLLGNGTRLAEPGEFTLRAFLNGRLDLGQAEAVADLIAGNSQKAHEIAFCQMRGSITHRLAHLREQLVNFVSLIELELDFSEEDVAFADRKELSRLLAGIEKEIIRLTGSFSYGNAIKNGIPAAIIGKPNVGKSTLLNAVLDEEKAIVSAIAGTTRDIIEDNVVVEGITFRFIDTAGLRQTADEIEIIGIERTKKSIQKAKIVLYVFDKINTTPQDIIDDVKNFYFEGLTVLLIENKMDLPAAKNQPHFAKMIVKKLMPDYACAHLSISALSAEDVSEVKKALVNEVAKMKTQGNVTLTNLRHYEALKNAHQTLNDVQKGFQANIPSDLVVIDAHKVLRYLGEITGEVSIDKDILDAIFSRFCIGK